MGPWVLINARWYNPHFPDIGHGDFIRVQPEADSSNDGRFDMD